MTQRPPRPTPPDDLAWLLIYGTDAEIRAAASDPDRPKVSVDEAIAALREMATLGLSLDEAAAALGRATAFTDDGAQ